MQRLRSRNPLRMICGPSRVATSPRQSLIVRFMRNSAGRVLITSGGFWHDSPSWAQSGVVSAPRNSPYPTQLPRLLAQACRQRGTAESTRGLPVPAQSAPRATEPRFAGSGQPLRNDHFRYRPAQEGVQSKRKNPKWRRSFLRKWRCSPGFSARQELVEIEIACWGVKECNELRFRTSKLTAEGKYQPYSNSAESVVHKSLGNTSNL
jgi:hypothetical protein